MEPNWTLYILFLSIKGIKLKWMNKIIEMVFKELSLHLDSAFSRVGK